MRRAVFEALFVARRRTAFGKRLVEMPLMRRQLAKMLVRAEQARTMVFQTAEALRRSDAGEPGAYPLLRILTPLAKFRACRDARAVAGDAMDLTALHFARKRAPDNRNVWGAIAAVAVVTTLDICTAVGLDRRTGKSLPIGR